MTMSRGAASTDVVQALLLDCREHQVVALGDVPVDAGDETKLGRRLGDVGFAAEGLDDIHAAATAVGSSGAFIAHSESSSSEGFPDCKLILSG